MFFNSGVTFGEKKCSDSFYAQVNNNLGVVAFCEKKLFYLTFVDIEFKYINLIILTLAMQCCSIAI